MKSKCGRPLLDILQYAKNSIECSVTLLILYGEIKSKFESKVIQRLTYWSLPVIRRSTSNRFPLPSMYPLNQRI